MSQYLCFYLRNKTENLNVSLMDICHSSTLYRAFDFLPYGIARPITEQDIDEARTQLQESKTQYDESILDIETRIKLVMESSSPMNEKIEAMDNYMANISEIKEDRKDIEEALGFVSMLGIIFAQHDVGVDDYRLYGGIEVSGFEDARDLSSSVQ